MQDRKDKTNLQQAVEHLSIPKNRVSGENDAENNNTHPFVQAPHSLLTTRLGVVEISATETTNLAQVCRLFHDRFQHAALAKKLGHYAAWGKQEETENMLTGTNPALFAKMLKTTVTVKDYKGHSHTGTALQLALKMGDVTHDENQECMAELINRYLCKLPDGEGIVKRQAAIVFGDDFDAHLARQRQNVYSLDAVVTAINDATENQLEAQLIHQDNGSTLNQTIALFREQFTERSLQEAVFNPYHVLNALQVYNAKFNDLNWDQRNLFWRQIIGYMQRFWPRCWLQAAQTGFWNLTEKDPRAPLDRRVEVKNHMTDKMISLDRLDDDPNSRLGFDFAIYSPAGGWVADRVRAGAAVPYAARSFYKTYVEQKSEPTKLIWHPKPRTEESGVSVCNLLKCP